MVYEKVIVEKGLKNKKRGFKEPLKSDAILISGNICNN